MSEERRLSEVVPALSAAEWAEGYVELGSGWDRESDGYPCCMTDSGNGSLGVAVAVGEHSGEVFQHRRHAMAAPALHGQPFGFTWDMVDALHSILDDARVCHGDRCCGVSEWKEAEADSETAEAAIARVEALLPPRDMEASNG